MKLRHILLAEDNPNDVELALTALDRQGLANRVVVVNDGEEVLDYLHCRGRHAARKTGDPAVVLLDLKMPKMNGLDVLRVVSGDPKLAAIPFVVLTSSREEADLVRSYKNGANAYVIKPINFDEFMKAVRDLGLFWALLNEPPPDGVAQGAVAGQLAAKP